VLQGTSTRLKTGDYVLVVENEQQSGEKATARQISTITTDKTSSTTTVTWLEEPDVSYENVTLYALRVSAAPFGNNAPNWLSLPATLTNSDGKHPDAPAQFKESWDDLHNARAYVPSAGQLFLDSTSDDAKGTDDNPGWVVMIADKTNPFIAHITDARPVST